MNGCVECVCVYVVFVRSSMIVMRTIQPNHIFCDPILVIA